MKKIVTCIFLLLAVFVVSEARAKEYYLFIEKLGFQKGEIDYIAPVDSHTVSASERAKYIVIVTDFNDSEAKEALKPYFLKRTKIENLNIEKVDYDTFFAQYSEDLENFTVLNKLDKGDYWEVRFRYTELVATGKKKFIVDVDLLKEVEDGEKLEISTVDELFKHRVNPGLSIRSSASVGN